MFSQHIKAKFAIFNNKNEMVGKPHPVLINPADLTVKTSNRTQQVSSTGESDNDDKTDAVLLEGATKKTLNMMIYFDIVNKYELMLKKNNNDAIKTKTTQLLKVFDSEGSFLEQAGSTISIITTEANLTSCNVMSRTLCCLSILEEAAIEKNTIMFTWGSMRFAGIITDFTIKYTYFSNQGAPLRAELNLTIDCYPAMPTDIYTPVKREEAKLNAKSMRPSQS